MHCDLSASGRKEVVQSTIQKQFGSKYHELFEGVSSLIRNSSGTHVSITASLGSSPSRTHGSVIITLSSWTPKE